MTTKAAADGDWVTLEVSDGTSMRAFTARPTRKGRGPGLILVQEAYGVDAHIRDVAARFAREGFAVVAPEMYHRTAPGFVGDYNDFPALRPHMEAMTIDGNAADVRAAHEWLTQQEDVDAARTAALGYCMGGRISWVANATLPLAAAVSYYGGGIAPALIDRAPDLHGPHLLFWAGTDQRILPEHHRAVADALHAAKKRFVNVEFSHAGHGFFNDARGAYDAEAAKESWALVLAFFAQHIGAPAA